MVDLNIIKATDPELYDSMVDSSSSPAKTS